MQNAADRPASAIAAVGNPTAMGLDTQRGHLPAEFAPRDESAQEICACILRYNRALLEGMHDLIRVVKVQAAYYEMYGLPGITAFSETLRLARELGYIAIADCKRNDIGATAGAYAKAYLSPEGGFSCDFVTVNPYLGADGIKPFAELAGEYGRGLYVLVKTSNPSGVELQDQALADGRKVYELMADLVSHWGPRSSAARSSGFG